MSSVAPAILDEMDAGIDVEARRLVANLHNPSPKIFWADLFGTAAIGWTALWLAVAGDLAITAGATVIAALAFYRGLCFLHEITHIRQTLLRGFETAWNTLFGVPLLFPSIVYVGVHQNHHKLSTYGTDDDPEYLPFAGKPLMVYSFLLQSVLIPLFLLIRFVVAAPIGLVIPAVHRFFETHATALSMNIKYRRAVNDQIRSKMRRQELAILVVWSLAVAAAAAGFVPWKLFAVWFAATALASLVNTLRTLAAHHYESDGAPRDRAGQLSDSVDVPGAWWTELWAPVGLRYHAMHHFFPGIPYHNLPEAYRRISATLPSYRESTRSSLLASLSELVRR